MPNDIALVTGANKGIGRAIAADLAEAGVSLSWRLRRRSTLRLPGPIAAKAIDAALRFSTYS